MTNKTKLDEVANVLATSLFQDMRDPAMKGPSFTWKGFPEMAAKKAASEAFMYFPHKLTQEDEDYVESVARKAAVKLIETNAAAHKPKARKEH